jgi:hypothetical protein
MTSSLPLMLDRTDTIMATPRHIEAASKTLEDLAGQLARCEEIAQALVETGQPWDGRIGWLTEDLTDFDRARRVVIKDLDEVGRQLRRLRRTELSPEAIRATGTVAEIRAACGRCIETNKANTAAGKSFVCLARNTVADRSNARTRFQLDARGNIIES